MGAPTFHSGSRVSLHPLTVRQEDGDFIVGRIETGTFISLPEVGVRALEILREGETLHEAEAQLATEDGSTVDLQAFAVELLNLGFVAAVDGDPTPSPVTARSHLPWLQPRHVRWLFSRPVAAVFWTILAAAAVTAILHPDLLPVYNDYFWSPLLSLVIAVNLVLGTFHLVIHEIAHLVAARAEGIPALIRWGTRLQYFVVQTDVSGAWALPRFARYRIYLAGILWDLLAVSLLILASAYAGLPATGQALLAAWILLIFFGLVYQFSFYMRTDIYFVLLDLLHSRNLFQDAQRLLRHRYRRGLHRLLPNRGPLPPDPLLTLSASERRKVAFYAGLLITGTMISLGCYLFFGIPILLQMVSQAAGGLVTGLQTRDTARLLDSGLTLFAIVGTHALFVAAFVHGRRGAIASAFATIARMITPHPALPSGPPQSDAPPPPVAP
jgi:hypothetical protein